MTTLRSTNRAEATAAQVAKELGIDARDIFICLNLDFKNPNHFGSADFVNLAIPPEFHQGHEEASFFFLWSGRRCTGRGPCT